MRNSIICALVLLSLTRRGFWFKPQRRSFMPVRRAHFPVILGLITLPAWWLERVHNSSVVETFLSSPLPRASDAEDWETPCLEREDLTHCVHWYDGAPCCDCGAPAAPDCE